MPEPIVQTSNKSKTVTLVLCIFLGCIGAHDFYLGKFGKGFVKMITMNWFCIGWIIDIIKIASNSYLDAAGVAIIK